MTAAAPARQPITTRITPRHTVAFRFYLRELWRRRQLVRVLAIRQLKARHEFNLQGFLFWLAEPLTLTLVYVLVIGLIFQRGGNIGIPYPLFIVLGIFPWKWMASTVTHSMGVVRSNRSLITDVYFPRALLPIVEVSTGLAHFLVGLLVIPLFMLAYRIGPSWHLLWLPVIVAVQYLFVLGVSYPMAVFGLLFKNMTAITNNVIRLWFYLSPVIWPLERLADHVSPEVLTLAKLNPAVGLIEAYRDVFVRHSHPDWTLAYVAGLALFLLAFGGRFFARREAQFGKLL